jgi:hypothetical protein
MPNYSGIWTEQAVMQANGAGNWPNAPGAPTIGTATNTGAGGAVSVAFTAPTFAGIPAVITSYTVTSSPGGLTGTGASSPITVSGLTEGTAYTFTVTATNASGTSPASAASNSVTPITIVYIEETFSTYLYTGNGSTQTITNGINLSVNGGLVWQKSRSDALSHVLSDTVRGTGVFLESDNTGSQSANANSITAFNTTGFSFGSLAKANTNAATYVSWTFRKQPKFFDVVTYTGDGTNGRAIAHSINGTVGMAVVKSINNAGSGYDGWYVRHRSATGLMYLNLTNAQEAGFGQNITALSDNSVTVGGDCNESGETYIMYIFAHNAGGFGLTGTDNVISCGSFVPDGSGNATVSLGYEPQWVLTQSTSGGSWQIQDSMRGMPVGGQGQRLRPNSSAAEDTTDTIRPNATGFSVTSFGASQTYIYIAIRRGPMAVPTSATTVFTPLALNNASGTVNTTGFPVDLQMQFYRPGGISPGTSQWIDRLRGFSSTSANTGPRLYTTGTEAEVDTAIGTMFSNTGFSTGTGWANVSMSYNNFRRAPSFFDEVCYTGTGSAQNVAHNLGVIPGFIVCKRRNGTANWCALAGKSNGTYESLYLNGTGATLYTAPSAAVAGLTATTFDPQAVFPSEVNGSGDTYVAYLFATCAGVSKVGSYTGTATTLQIDCGFTAGSRFVLIKRTDSTGDWYVWDSARGIIAGNDPYLLLNSTAAEVTNTDYVDTAATGFEISSTAPAAINANGGTFIFLAIA